MMEKAIDLFNKSGKDKVDFSPSIRVKMTPHSPIVWIDKMYKVKDTYMITVSTLNDCTNMNINSVDSSYISGITIRLYSMYGDKEKAEA